MRISRLFSAGHGDIESLILHIVDIPSDLIVVTVNFWGKTKQNPNQTNFEEERLKLGGEVLTRARPVLCDET